MKRVVVILLFLFALSSCENELPNDNPISCDTGYTIVNEECVDQEAPVITVSGEDVIILFVGDEVPDWDVDIDDVDPDTTLIVSGVDDLDLDTTGTYIIYYNAVDSSGNLANEVKKTIHVVNRAPAVMVSFAGEYIDSVTMRVTAFSAMDNLESLSLLLYDGDTLIETQSYEVGVESYVFDGLTPNINYQVRIEGTYQSGSRLGVIPFEKNPITVGTYRKLDSSYEQYTSSPEHFQLLQTLVFLPFDPSNDAKTEDMIKRLGRIDYDIMFELSSRIGGIIFVNNHVSDVPDYADYAQQDIIPYIAGMPSVILIDYHGTSIDITTQMIGMHITMSYLPMIDLTTYWTDIYDQEALAMFPSSRYSENPYDFFIECFAYYYYSDASRASLLETAPQAHNFIASLQSIYEGETYSDWEDMIVFPE